MKATKQYSLRVASIRSGANLSFPQPLSCMYTAAECIRTPHLPTAPSTDRRQDRSRRYRRYEFCLDSCWQLRQGWFTAPPAGCSRTTSRFAPPRPRASIFNIGTVARLFECLLFDVQFPTTIKVYISMKTLATLSVVGDKR